jgi:hypothetical protein
MMENDPDRPDPAYVAIYEGTVTRRDDPLRIGRVKLTVPGLLEPESDWALPAAVVGGGEAQMGIYAVPEVGAEVVVWFVQGDADRPRYAPGHWGAPGGTPQSPTPVKDLSAEDAPKVRVWETPRHLLVFDCRGGSEAFRIIDKSTGDGVVYDAAARQVDVLGQVIRARAPDVELGVDPTDMVALAQLCLNEYQKIATTLATGTTPAGGPVTFATPYVPSSVAASQVKAK